jgi:Chaperone of endosialidase
MKLQNLIHIVTGIVCIGLLPNAPAAPAPEKPDPGAVGGTFNTADGTNALAHITTGVANGAFGWFSLLSNTDGSWNTGVGAGTLLLNIGNQTTGDGLENTAVGAVALLLNTTGSNNTAVGTAALLNNSIADQNTATGAFALNRNTAGSFNTATGYRALFSNTTGNLNTADGAASLFSNTTGTYNAAVGCNALFSNTIGMFNTAVGYESLTNNIAGSENVALGHGAGLGVTTASNVICIGADGTDVNNSCFIGNIRDVTTQNADAIAVVIDSAGQLGTVSSSARFKDEIKPMDKASESILALTPVTFHYKSDSTGTPQFGLIAEEVAKVNPDLVVRDKNGEIYTVRYEAVNAMLLNEFLKEHRKVQEQEAAITQLKKDFGTTVAQLTARVDEQASQIQKVSAQLEASKPAPQMVNNP